MSTKNTYRTRHIYTLAAHVTLGELDKQTSRRLTSATCTTVHVNTLSRNIYIINFAYITTTTTSYERRPDQYIRGEPRPQYNKSCRYLLMSLHLCDRSSRQFVSYCRCFDFFPFSGGCFTCAMVCSRGLLFCAALTLSGSAFVMWLGRGKI